MNVAEQLSAPFAETEVEFKPQVIQGQRAMVIAYVDARCVMYRLDAALGIGNWQDSFDVLPDGNVVCRLSIRLAAGSDEWITRMDVGSESDQKDVGDKRKAAFSDALKRAAVKFGVGRYIYSLPQFWVDYDPQKKTFKPPQLPSWALPKPDPSARIRQVLASCHTAIERYNRTQTDPTRKTTWWAALTWAATKTNVPIDLGSSEEWLEPQTAEDLERLVPLVNATMLGLILESLTVRKAG